MDQQQFDAYINELGGQSQNPNQAEVPPVVLSQAEQAQANPAQQAGLPQPSLDQAGQAQAAQAQSPQAQSPQAQSPQAQPSQAQQQSQQAVHPAREAAMLQQQAQAQREAVQQAGPSSDAPAPGNGAAQQKVQSNLEQVMHGLQPPTGSPPRVFDQRPEGQQRAPVEDIFVPRPIKSLKEGGLGHNDMYPIVLRYLFLHGSQMGNTVARQVRVPYVVIEPVLSSLKNLSLIHI